MRSIYTIAFTLLASVAALSGAHAVTMKDSPLAAEETTVAMDSSPVDDSDLSASRGAFTPADSLLNINNASLTSNSSNNVVNGGVTGGNQITGGFTNTQGLVNVIQNTGNNVTIQSATIVNMTMINN